VYLERVDLDVIGLQEVENEFQLVDRIVGQLDNDRAPAESPWTSSALSTSPQLRIGESKAHCRVANEGADLIARRTERSDRWGRSSNVVIGEKAVSPNDLDGFGHDERCSWWIPKLVDPARQIRLSYPSLTRALASLSHPPNIVRWHIESLGADLDMDETRERFHELLDDRSGKCGSAKCQFGVVSDEDGSDTSDDIDASAIALIVSLRTIQSGCLHLTDLACRHDILVNAIEQPDQKPVLDFRHSNPRSRS
jgi:hypothetical protein